MTVATEPLDDPSRAQLRRPCPTPVGTAERCRALLLDADLRHSLTACRALGRAGHEVGVCVGVRDRLAAHSRYATRLHPAPDSRGESEPFAAAINEIVSAYRYDVVLAMHDWTLGRLAALESPLSVPCFPTAGPSAALLADKVVLESLCRQVGAAYPATSMLGAGLDCAAAVTAVGGLPVVVKAARSAEVTPARVAYRQGATVAATTAEVLASACALRDAGLVPIVQARVDAVEKINAAIIRRPNDTELRYAHRVLREVPSTGGVGIALETIDATAGTGGEATAILERLCAATGHTGVAQAEMYRARGDGRLYVVDVNPRLWGSTWFAERLGLGIVDRGVRLALGLPPPPGNLRYPIGRRFHHLPGEWRWLREHGASRAAIRELRDTTRPWDVFDGDQVSDPLPLIHTGLQGVATAWRRRAAGTSAP